MVVHKTGTRIIVATPFIGHKCEHAHTPLHQDTQGATTTISMQSKSSSHSICACTMLKKPVQSKLINPAETPEGRNEMLHGAPEVMLDLPTNHGLLT